MPEASRRLGIPVSRYIDRRDGGRPAGSPESPAWPRSRAIQGRLVSGISPGYGFMGFLVAWLAGGSAIGIVAMAFLFAVISSVGDILQITQGVPYAVVNILMAVILFIVLGQRKPTGARRDEHALRRRRAASSILSGTSLLYATLGEVGRRARRHRQSRPRRHHADRRRRRVSPRQR